jgi:hypothetical protein
MGKQSRFENGKTVRALEPGTLHSVVDVCARSEPERSTQTFPGRFIVLLFRSTFFMLRTTPQSQKSRTCKYI